MQDKIIAIGSIIVLTFVLSMTVYSCTNTQKDLMAARFEVIDLQRKLSDCQIQSKINCLQHIDSVLNATQNDIPINKPNKPHFLR